LLGPCARERARTVGSPVRARRDYRLDSDTLDSDYLVP
jgi:hypothetical protein